MRGLRTSTFFLLVLGSMVFGVACSCSGNPGGNKDAGATDAGNKDGGSVDAGPQSPVVTITAPADGSSFPVGQSITFTGSATDPQDGPITGNALAWTSDQEGQLGLGATVTTALSVTGPQVITLTATDSQGNSASASVNITLTPANAPVVVITSPPDGYQASIGEQLTFRATVTPVGTATVANANIVWNSDVDGPIGIGAQVQNAFGNLGTRTITCTATDSTGAVGSASITVDVVANKPPVVTITSPADGSYFKPTTNITFTGTATSPNPGGTIQAGSLVWSSSMGGQIGFGATVTSQLPLGDNVITFQATDNQGTVGQATITVHIVSNLPPVCTITRPRANDTVLQGQPVNLIGSCNDPETGPITTGLTWTSDVDGQLGVGSPAQSALATAGTQNISLCAVDPVDPTLTGCATVQISVVANTAPTCAINAPAPGDVVTVGVPVALNGSVTDAEDPALTGVNPTAQWTDDLGNVLSNRQNGNTMFAPAQAGARTLTLTGTDSGGLTCAATVSIVVNRPPTATITSMLQNGSATPPYTTAASVDFTGTGTDPDPGDTVTLDWVDSFTGSFGAGNSASLATPVVGRHTVYLNATDNWGGVGQDTRTFVVYAPGQTQLVAPYTTANATLGQNNRSVTSLAVTASDFVYLGNPNATLWNFDGTSTAATANPNGQLPDNALAIFIDAADGLMYIGTQGSGIQVCPYNPPTPVDTTLCQRYQGGGFPSDNVYAVVRMTGSDGNDYLIVGTRNGLFVPDTVTGSNTGTRVPQLQGSDVRGLAVDGSRNVVWVATNGDGLFTYDPVTGQTQRWDRGAGAPSNNLYCVALGTGDLTVWVGSDRGLGEYQPVPDTWSQWRAGGAPAPGLVNDTVQALAIDTPSVGGSVRDVVWAGTQGGVSRFDPTVPSFMSLTTADGLPSNNVRAIVILSSGTKVFGTANGVAQYTGQ